MQQKKFNTYKFTHKHRRGITDLENECAFYGASQGDESVSNLVSDYEAGWMCVSQNFKDIDYHNQQEVNRRLEDIIERNAITVARLISEGKYGEEYDHELTINFVSYPGFNSYK